MQLSSGNQSVAWHYIIITICLHHIGTQYLFIFVSSQNTVQDEQDVSMGHINKW